MKKKISKSIVKYPGDAFKETSLNAISTKINSALSTIRNSNFKKTKAIIQQSLELLDIERKKSRPLRWKPKNRNLFFIQFIYTPALNMSIQDSHPVLMQKINFHKETISNLILRVNKMNFNKIKVRLDKVLIPIQNSDYEKAKIILEETLIQIDFQNKLIREIIDSIENISDSNRELYTAVKKMTPQKPAISKKEERKLKQENRKIKEEEIKLVSKRYEIICNSISDHLNLTIEEKDFLLQHSKLKLQIELMPYYCIGSNVRSNLKYKWRKLSGIVAEKANHKCEICGGQNERKLDCHEVWDYDEENVVQILSRLQALCVSCHHVKHMGSMGMHMYMDILENGEFIRVFKQINNLDEELATKIACSVSKQHYIRNIKYTNWKLNLEHLKEYGFDITHTDREERKEELEKKQTYYLRGHESNGTHIHHNYKAILIGLNHNYD